MYRSLIFKLPLTRYTLFFIDKFYTSHNVTFHVLLLLAVTQAQPFPSAEIKYKVIILSAKAGWKILKTTELLRKRRNLATYRFSECRSWICQYSGMWYRADWYIGTNVSEKLFLHLLSSPRKLEWPESRGRKLTGNIETNIKLYDVINED